MCNTGNRGFTLLELMLAALLSAVITCVLIKIAVALQMEINRQQQQIHQIETLRFVSYQLSNDNRKDMAENCKRTLKNPVIAFSGKSFVLLQCIEYHQQWQVLPVHYFIERNHYQHLALYQQPDNGSPQQMAEQIIALDIRKKAGVQGFVIWLLMRSAQRIYHGKHCYFFSDQRYCRKDGYYYFAWPVYVG